MLLGKKKKLEQSIEKYTRRELVDDFWKQYEFPDLQSYWQCLVAKGLYFSTQVMFGCKRIFITRHCLISFVLNLFNIFYDELPDTV